MLIYVKWLYGESSIGRALYLVINKDGLRWLLDINSYYVVIITNATVKYFHSEIETTREWFQPKRVMLKRYLFLKIMHVHVRMRKGVFDVLFVSIFPDTCTSRQNRFLLLLLNAPTYFLWYSTELGSNWYLGNEGVEGKALLRRGTIFQVYIN